MEITSKKLASLLLELGVPVTCVAETESPSYMSYHFEVCRISDFKNVERQIPILSAFLQKNIIYEKSNIGHFALMIAKDKRTDIYLLDKKYKNIVGNIEKPFTIFAGIDTENNKISFNLKDVPHLLIAGTTGSGKSVMINSVICELLLNSPYMIKFTMIDTKRVELSRYKKLGDKNCRVATDFVTAINYLKDVCDDIDARYEIMEKNNWVNIPDDFYREVVVVEELNDLMMASKKAVEQYIVKIAQLGRACGVHLLIATQRPVVETLTGAIKANIDCRIALKTTSSIDSRNILGHSGAEKLKGKGDALLKLPTNDEEVHIQCPFISPEEVDDIVEKYNAGGLYEYCKTKKTNSK